MPTRESDLGGYVHPVRFLPRVVRVVGCTGVNADAPNQPEWLTTEQVAGLIQVSVQKLKNDRVAGRGLPFAKLGSTVRYRRSEVDRYLELVTTYPRLPAA